MANGSFGLSGLPSAPTTVSGSSGANTPLTPVSVPMNSTSGFQSGDLIYNYIGDIAPVPGNLISSATFPVLENSPAYVQNVSFGQEVAPIVNTGSAYKVRNTAKLTSGNIVVVYLIVNSQSTSPNYPAFKIVDEAGTVVVAQTIIGSGSLTGSQGNISVCALSGGGFAVAWYENTNNYVSYAIYSNTGTVVKAAATDTGVGTVTDGTTFVQTYARPDGSWILAYSVTIGAQLWYKVFSATGVQVYAWTNPGTNQGTNYQFDFVVRSDNSFVIIFINASSILQYQIRSSTNVISTALTTIPSATSVSSLTGWGGATLLAGDVTLVTWVTGGTPRYSSISSAGVASAAVAYPFYTLGGFSTYARPFTLSDGNYILAYYTSTSTANSQYGYSLNYAVLNSSHTLVSGVNQTLFSVCTSSNAFFSFTQTTNFIHLCYSPLPIGASFGSSPPNTQTQINWLKLSPTTYQPVTAFSVSSTVGTSSAQPVSGYARSGSTPTAASFLASATTNISVSSAQTTTASTLVVGQTTLDADTAMYGLDTATLNDGSALVLYMVGANIKLARISSTGVLLFTITLATDGYNSSAPSGVKIAVLSSGKIACGYISSTSGTVKVQILSSAYALETTVTITNVSWPNVASGFDITALTSDRFALVYQQSTTGVYFRVYSSSGTLVVSDTQLTSDSTSYSTTCAGTQNGFYVAYFHPTTGSLKYFFYQETSTNSFNATGTQTISTSSRYMTTMRAITAPNGTVQHVYANTNISQINGIIHYSNANPTTTGLTITGMTLNVDNSSAFTLGITAYGDTALVYWESATAVRMVYYTAGYAGGGAQSTYSVVINGLSMRATGTDNYFTASALTGHNILFLARNNAGQLSYCVINPLSYTYTLPLTAGVTASTPVSLANRGISLVGVSTTSAPANGSGTVQINGSVQLSSSYPSTTSQNFDFQNPVTFGVAGSISGRNVTLIGNV